MLKLHPILMKLHDNAKDLDEAILHCVRNGYETTDGTGSFKSCYPWYLSMSNGVTGEQQIKDRWG